MAPPTADRPDGQLANTAIDARRALNVAIGERVREVRQAVGIGQAECARAAGIDKSSMFRLEKGELNLTIETLGRLSIALDVPMERLVGGVAAHPSLVGRKSRG